ncbi:MAG TPA: hypothetical protein VFZ00_24910, partial [Solirubrobacter sp.]|nr:hypothetical protein [Solirubrobacter sp.]
MLTRLAVLIVALFTLVAAPAASAGTYDVFSCRFPDGSRAPVDGWQPVGSGSRNRCAVGGGGLNAELPTSSIGVGTFVGWRFDAP